MNEIPVIYYLYLASFLFSAGIFTVLAKRNAVYVLIGVELMLNAANLVLVTFSRYDPSFGGQIMGLFVVVLTVCEVSIALAILLNIYKKYRTSDLDEVQEVGN